MKVAKGIAIREGLVVCEMTRGEAIELRHQMKAFWENLSVGRQPPSGDSPFARIYEELGKALGERP